MKLIDQSAEIWIQGSLLEGVYKQIERAGRICYKSEDKITEDSAKPFVERMIASKHYAMLEHGTVYLKEVRSCYGSCHLAHYKTNKYSFFKEYAAPEPNDNAELEDYVTTNLRVIVENGWMRDLQYICSPTKWHAKRVTVHCTTNRQVTHELVRHRVMSFAQESTRYCNYSKGKFGGELTFIKPCWIEEITSFDNHSGFEKYLEHCETLYFGLVNSNWKPQQAATILPNAIKAEIVITGFVDDWKHLFDLRVLGTTGAPHPQMKELMTPVYNQFIEKGYIDGTMV